jgi:hypothetical protein
VLQSKGHRVAGVILVSWIVGEVLILTGDDELVSPVEAVYLVVGLTMIGLGLLVARRAKQLGPQG